MQHSGQQLNYAYFFGQLRKFIRNDNQKNATEIGQALGDLEVLENFVSDLRHLTAPRAQVNDIRATISGLLESYRKTHPSGIVKSFPIEQHLQDLLDIIDLPSSRAQAEGMKSPDYWAGLCAIKGLEKADFRNIIISVQQDALSSRQHSAPDDRELFEKKTVINCRAQKRYDELMAIGKHGHYETMFQVIHEEINHALTHCIEVTPPDQKYVSLSNTPQWQPIETAPRDGTSILLFHKHFGIVQGWYAPLEISHDHEGNDTSEGDFWVICDDAIEVEVEHNDNQYLDGPVTHWMPLLASPTPPESA